MHGPYQGCCNWQQGIFPLFGLQQRQVQGCFDKEVKEKIEELDTAIVNDVNDEMEKKAKEVIEPSARLF